MKNNLNQNNFLALFYSNELNESQAINFLLDNFRNYLEAVARGTNIPHEEAQELVSDAILAFYKKCTEKVFELSLDLKNYLRRVVKNMSISLIRSRAYKNRQMQGNIETIEIPPADYPEPVHIKRNQHKLILRIINMLGDLGPYCKSYFELKEYEQLSWRQIKTKLHADEEKSEKQLSKAYENCKVNLFRAVMDEMRNPDFKESFFDYLIDEIQNAEFKKLLRKYQNVIHPAWMFAKHRTKMQTEERLAMERLHNKEQDFQRLIKILKSRSNKRFIISSQKKELISHTFKSFSKILLKKNLPTTEWLGPENIELYFEGWEKIEMEELIYRGLEKLLFLDSQAEIIENYLKSNTMLVAEFNILEKERLLENYW